MKQYVYSVMFMFFSTCSLFSEAAQFYAGASYLNTESDLRSDTDNDSGFEARVGYKLTSNIAVETSYLDFGTHEFPQIPDGGGSVDSDGWSVSVLGNYPLGDFSLFGKVGYLWWESDGQLGSIVGPVNFSTDDSDLTLGGGISFRATDHIELKAEYNSSDRFDWGSFGLNYHF